VKCVFHKFRDLSVVVCVFFARRLASLVCGVSSACVIVIFVWLCGRLLVTRVM